jgi:putative two-component system response regulator
LAAIEKHRPTLVLLDVGLPDTNGYDLCRQIKRLDITQGVQVIFITGFTDAEHEAAAFEAGGVDFISKPVLPQIVRARVSAQLSLVRATRLEQSYQDAVLMLGLAGHYNDADTGSHIWRMAAYARALAQAYGWDAERCIQLELAAPMHDTGKIGIPQAILRKPGGLDAQEWEVMKTHPKIGADILGMSASPVFQLAADVALRHHEKWDGSGYPDGLKGDAIPESARIVALADVFDALSMKRPYKEAWTTEKVVEHIQAGAGGHFEPALVQVFCDNLHQFLDIQEKWSRADHNPAPQHTAGLDLQAA